MCIRTGCIYVFFVQILKCIIVQDFRGVPQYGSSSAGRPWIGLEHANKVKYLHHYLPGNWCMFNPQILIRTSWDYF